MPGQQFLCGRAQLCHSSAAAARPAAAKVYATKRRVALSVVRGSGAGTGSRGAPGLT
ncbi:hypothetical protein AB0F96_05570 [Streptomyces sp. NPDC023998]|uniref:hypothetical protein n=1 Tax=Streptomyces sp. NPDC023998 TaxID=3154597 RepID=UPI0033D9A7BD